MDDPSNRYERYIDLPRLLCLLRPDGPVSLGELVIRWAFSATELSFLLVTESAEARPAAGAIPEAAAALVDRALRSAASILECAADLLSTGPTSLPEPGTTRPDGGVPGAAHANGPSTETGLHALERLPRRHARAVDHLTRTLLTSFQSLPTRLGLEPAAHALRLSFALPDLLAPADTAPFLPYDRWVRPAALRALPHGAEVPHGPEDRLFALTHQIAECWLALIGHLLQGALPLARRGSWAGAAERITAASRLLQHLAPHLDLLGHMLLIDYHPLRVALAGASLADSRAATFVLGVAPELFAPLLSALARAGAPLLEVLKRPESSPAEHAYLAALQDLEVAASGFFFHLDRLTSRLLGGPAGAATDRPLARITAPLFPALDAARRHLTDLADLSCAARRGAFFTDDRPLVSGPTTARDASTPVSPERLRCLVGACFALLSAGEVTAFVRLFGSDGAVEDPEGSLPFRGAAEIEAYLTTFLERFPGIRMGPSGDVVLQGSVATVPWSASGKSRLGDQAISFSGEAAFQFTRTGHIGSLSLRWSPATLAAELGYVERRRLAPPGLRPLGVAVLGHPSGPIARELTAALGHIPTRTWVPNNLYREGLPVEAMRWLSSCEKAGPGFPALVHGMSCAVVLAQPADLADLPELAPRIVAAVLAGGGRRLAWVLPAAADPALTARLEEVTSAADKNLTTLFLHYEPLFSHLLLCQDDSRTPPSLLLPALVESIRWTSARDVGACLSTWIREELPAARVRVAGPDALTAAELSDLLVQAARRAEAGRAAAEKRFQQIDRNGDGTLSKEELRSYLHAIGYGPGAVEAALQRADQDGNATLSFDEFSHELSAALGAILGELAAELRCVTTPAAELAATLVKRGFAAPAASALIACLGPAAGPIATLTAPESLRPTPLAEWALEHAVQLIDVHILPGQGILATRDAPCDGLEGTESRLVRPDGRTLLSWRAKNQNKVRLRWSDADTLSVAFYKYSIGEVRRTLEVRGERLVGITAEGPWPGLRDASELLFSGERVPGWMLTLFGHLGDLEVGNSSAADGMLCACAKVTRAKLLSLIDQGHHTLTRLSAQSRAGRLCGACRTDIEAILLECTRGALLPHEQSRT